MLRRCTNLRLPLPLPLTVRVLVFITDGTGSSCWSLKAGSLLVVTLLLTTYLHRIGI